MSFNVLVITEDFSKDEHIVGPLVRRILEESGKPKANILVCREPNFAGIGNALKISRLRAEVIKRYPMVQLFLLIVDRDGEPGREVSLANIEETFRSELAGKNQRFVAALAWQEVEVFILAGHDMSRDWKWQEIRQDRDVKNTFFQKLVAVANTSSLPHDGGKKLMAEAIKNWNRIRSLCQKDVGSLIAKLATPQ